MRMRQNGGGFCRRRFVITSEARSRWIYFGKFIRGSRIKIYTKFLSGQSKTLSKKTRQLLRVGAWNKDSAFLFFWWKKLHHRSSAFIAVTTLTGCRFSSPPPCLGRISFSDSPEFLWSDTFMVLVSHRLFLLKKEKPLNPHIKYGIYQPRMSIVAGGCQI